MQQPLRNVLLQLEYDGTDFVGWQIQPQSRTVEGTLLKALAKVLNEPEVRVTGAGRTDSGVHALAYPITFQTRSIIPLQGLVRGVNSLLPPDLRALDAREVPLDLSARRSAAGKRYRYRIRDGALPSAIHRNRAWQIRGRLDLEPMREASRCLVGRIDFSSFRASGCAAAHAVREIREVTIVRSGPEVVVEVEGTAFLRHMVRNIVGSLVEVGLGRMAVEEFRRGVKDRDRSKMGPGAPGHGLYLVCVFYEHGG